MTSSAIIVCPVDSSETTWRTVAYAVDLARFRDAELHLVYLPGVRAGKPRPVDACTADTTIDGAEATPLRHVALVDLSSQFPRGVAANRRHEARAIATYARLKGAELIVISAHYGAARRWRRSSWVARTLGRSAPCPVLIVPHDVSPLTRASRSPFATVVCAIDFTEASAAGLHTATELVRRSRGRLKLFHAVEEIPRKMVLLGGDALQVQHDYAARVTTKSQRLRRMVSIQALNTRQVEPIVVSGPPERGILQVAADIKADLIVMGVTPRSVLDEVLAGSTSRVVVQRATCPVLLVPITAAGATRQPKVEAAGQPEDPRPSRHDSRPSVASKEAGEAMVAGARPV